MARKPYWKRHRLVVRWIVAVFLISQVGLAVSVDQFAPNVRDPEYAQLQHLLSDRIAESPDQPVAVFVGSSRVVQGFDAARAAGDEQVVLFNFGVPGSGPYFQEIILDRLRASGIKPDILFLELLHPFLNAAGPQAMDQGLLDGARLSAGEAAGLLKYGSRSRTGPLRRWAYARLLPAYRHQAEIRDSLGLGVYPYYGLDAKFDAHGFRPSAEQPAMWAGLTRQAHECYDAFYPRFRLNEHVWELLTRTIRDAQNQGTTLAIVLMPEGSEFRGLSTPESEAARLEMLDRLRRECGVSVVDARDWLPDSAFYDQHHLLPEGARIFASRFRLEILQPALKVRRTAMQK